jgi:hypothetical protein
MAGPRLVGAAFTVIVALCGMTLATTGVDEEGVRDVVPVALLLGAWGLRLAARGRRPALAAA